MAGGEDTDVLENYLQQGVAPGVEVDPQTGDTTDPARAAGWLAQHWANWRGKLAETQHNALEADPGGYGMGVGSGLVGGGPELGVAGIMAGPKAAMADLGALRVATQMDKAGHAAEDIWKLTGWFKDIDKNWKFEIPDSGMKFKQTRKMEVGGHSRLSGAIDHPELYANYPEIKDLTYTERPDLVGDNMGLQWPGWGIGINPIVHDSLMELRRTGVHELQHVVQGQEGFAQGSSGARAAGALADVGMMPHVPGATPDDIAAWGYRNTAGEAEARNVENRLEYNNPALHPRLTADRLSSPIFMHQGHIYAPIEHDPFVGLAEARADLGRPPHPELGAPDTGELDTNYAPVDHDPFAPAAASQHPPDEFRLRVMESFDRLPPQVQEVLKNAPRNLNVFQVEKYYREHGLHSTLLWLKS